MPSHVTNINKPQKQVLSKRDYKLYYSQDTKRAYDFHDIAEINQTKINQILNSTAVSPPKQARIKKEITSLKNYKFKNASLEEEAFTHKTYAVENKIDFSNQRLEFLGDRVFDLIVADYLMHKYKKFPEGMLSSIKQTIVNEKQMAVFSRALGLDHRVKIGKGETQQGGKERDSLLSDVFEAYLGAIFKDSNFSTINKFCVDFLKKEVKNPSKLLTDYNPKQKLKEYFEKHCKEQKTVLSSPEQGIQYKIISQDVNKGFEIQVSINSQIMGMGKGATIKEAEQDAAAKACHTITNI